MNLENTQTGNNLEVTDLIKTTLLESAKWAKLLAIIGFVGIGLLVVMGIFMGTIMSLVDSLGSYGVNEVPYEALGGVFISVFYFVMGLLYFFPIKYLYDFATKVKKAIMITDQQLFTEAVLKLKAHYRYIGILMIVMFILYFVIILFSILSVFLMSSY